MIRPVSSNVSLMDASASPRSLRSVTSFGWLFGVELKPQVQLASNLQSLINDVESTTGEHKLVGHEAVRGCAFAHQYSGMGATPTTISVAASFGRAKGVLLSRYSPGPVGVVPYRCFTMQSGGCGQPAVLGQLRDGIGGLAWTDLATTRVGPTRLRESSSCSADAQEAGHRDMARLRPLARNARRRAVWLAPRLALFGPLTSSRNSALFCSRAKAAAPTAMPASVSLIQYVTYHPTGRVVATSS